MMDLDSIISTIEGKKSTAAKATGGIDIDAILKDFDIKPDVVVKAEPKKASSNVAGEPHPPISGVSKEASDELNATRTQSKGLPTDYRPTSPAAAEHWKSGQEMFSSGVEDLGSGHPYKGLGKTALGGLMIASSPVSGIIDDTIGKYGNKLGPGLGDRAAAIVGSAVPVIPGVGATSKLAAGLPLVNKLSPYSKNKALSTLVESIGPENLPMVVREMKANPRLTPADLSPQVLQDTQKLFTKSGPQINYLKNTSDARMATRKSIMEEAYDTAGGISPNLQQKIADLAAASIKVGTEQINPLVKAAKPVNLTDTISNIDAVLKQGVMSKVTEGTTLAVPEVKENLGRARNLLTNGKETRTGAEDLHDIQKSLRRQAWDKINSGDPAQREIGHALMKVRNDIVSDIDKSSKGYADALHAYRDEMHIADAFREGHDKILTSSKKLENDPSYVKKWFDGLSDNEKAATKEGVRAAIYTEMGVAKNPALAGESVMRSDFNKAKMEIILGKEEASKLFKTLEDERKIANTHNKIVEGSQTAMRNASDEKLALPTKKEVGQGLVAGAMMETGNILAHGTPGVGSAMLGAAYAANSLKHNIATKIAKEHNAQLAKHSLPTEGPSRDELIRQLESFIPQPKLSMLNKVRTALPTSTP